MIIPALFRILPGAVWLRTLILLAAAAALVVVLFEFTFPWFAATFVVGDADVGTT